MIDLGGATTDVHAAVALKPAPVGIRTAGLPALPLRRTVEGDLGMRWSAPGTLDADGDWLEAEGHAAGTNTRGASPHACARRQQRARVICRTNEDEDRIDRALATACVTHALQRHCGVLKHRLCPRSRCTDFEQRGADLRDVPLVIGTGGMLSQHAEAETVLRTALERRTQGSLTPRAPALALDRHYMLAAAGLLSTVDETGARALLQRQRLIA